MEFTTAYATSDRRWKKEIKPLENSLTIIQNLEGVRYLWNRAEYPDKGFSDDLQIGLIAQDVERVLPAVVKTDAAGYKSIAYSQLIPVLIEEIKSQQVIIEQQQKDLKTQKQSLQARKQSLQAQINKLRYRLEDLVGTRM